jgi:hypothetical protein
MKFESGDNTEEKARYKIIRTDSYRDVPGDIIAADEVTGEVTLQVKGETQQINFGPHSIRIVLKRK